MYRYRLSIGEPIYYLYQLIGHLDCNIDQCRQMIEGHVCFLLLQSGPKSQFSFDEYLQPHLDITSRTSIIDQIHDQLLQILRPVIADEAIYIEFYDNGDVEITIDDFDQQLVFTNIEEDPTHDYAWGSGRP